MMSKLSVKESKKSSEGRFCGVSTDLRHSSDPVRCVFEMTCGRLCCFGRDKPMGWRACGGGKKTVELSFAGWI